MLRMLQKYRSVVNVGPGLDEGIVTFSDRPVLLMVTEMLDKAFAKISDNTNLILHSNQGWQSRTNDTRESSARKAFVSMRRKGNCVFEKMPHA